MPASMEAALEEAGKLESIEAAQKRLQRVKTGTSALPVAVAAIEESEIAQANAVSRGSETSLDSRVEELMKGVKRLTQELAQLRGEKGEQRFPRSTPRRNPNIVCWNCGQRAKLSPTEGPSAAFKLLRADGAGQPSANSPVFVGSVQANSTVTVVGKIKDQVTTMLVDTGSAVTVVRADLWGRITTGHPIELKPRGGRWQDLGIVRSGVCCHRGWRCLHSTD